MERSLEQFLLKYDADAYIEDLHRLLFADEKHSTGIHMLARFTLPRVCSPPPASVVISHRLHHSGADVFARHNVNVFHHRTTCSRFRTFSCTLSSGLRPKLTALSFACVCRMGEGVHAYGR
jgi:hypothetical protein